jgi:WD40-like Beta Propeller Repeat
LKGRDLAIVAAVVLLGGFALADSLRGRGEERSVVTSETVRDGRNGPEPQPDAPADWPAGRLRGTLVFTDEEDCRIRVIGLGGGRERPVGELVGFCRLWAAPIGQRIAYNTGGVRGSSGDSFAVVDLRRAGVEVASIDNLTGNVLWSPDAQRLAWCDQDLNGFELDIGDEQPRKLVSCPVGYDPEGRLAFVRSKRLVVAGTTVVAQETTITYAHWGVDDSLLVVLPSGTVRRFDRDGSVDEISLGDVGNIDPSPDNCGLLVQAPGRSELVDIGCVTGREISFIAFDAAWSPDGQWIAVAATDQIEFHRVVGGEETIAWPARARELYWRGD